MERQGDASIRFARLATPACLLVAGAVALVSSWDELTCVGDSICANKAGVAALVSIVSLIAIGWSLWRGWRIARMPANELPDGPALGPAMLFGAGGVAIALLIPVARCPGGEHLDPIFRLCIEGTRRSAAIDQTWVKWLTAVVAVAGAVVIVTMQRWLVARTVLAVTVWLVGIGWLLRETMIKGL